jgi:DNA-binding NarL/FixJ family response regulator
VPVGAGSLDLLVRLVRVAGPVHDDRCLQGRTRSPAAGCRHLSPVLPSTGELSYIRLMGISVRIAVSDPLPVFRRGILAILGDAGFEPETREELLTWIIQERHPIVLLTLQGADDWALLAQLRTQHSHVLVVAILVDTNMRSYLQAILAGAVAAVPRDALPETMRMSFEAVVAGRSVLPIEVVRALASSRSLPEDHESVPSAREIDWLRQLANGTTVAQLADAAGYSERAMFRLLRNLYLRIGARNRTEALMRAKGQGWL